MKIGEFDPGDVVEFKKTDGSPFTVIDIDPNRRVITLSKRIEIEIPFEVAENLEVIS